MISIPNNVRFRFRDSDRIAQVICSTKDYNKMIKGFCKATKTSKEIAKNYIHASFLQEIKRVYGEPSQVTIILEESNIVIH